MGGTTRPLEDLRESARARPDDPDAWLALAAALVVVGDRKQAYQVARHAHALSADHAPNLLRTAAVYDDLGRREDALNAVRRALHVEPTSRTASLQMGRLLLRAHDPTAAALTLQVGLTHHPDDAEILLALAEAFLDARRPKDALRHAEKALVIGDLEVAAYGLLARVYRALGRTQDELTALSRLVALDDTDVQAAVDLGERLALEGRRDEAIRLLNEQGERAPNRADLQLHLGRALVAARALGPAVRRLRQALRIDPDLAEAHLELGSALRLGGALGEAVQCLERAERLLGGSARASHELGLALRESGRIREASAALIRAAAKAPEDDEIEADLAETLALLKQPAPSSPIPRENTDGGITSDLSTFSLAELLEFLVNQRATGELLLRTQRGHAGLRLVQGMIAQVHHPEGRTFAEAVVEEELIALTDLKRALSDPDPLRSHALHIPDRILNGNLADRSVLFRLFEHEVVAGLRALVEWRDGFASFHRSGSPDPLPVLLVDTRWALLEAYRALDEARR